MGSSRPYGKTTSAPLALFLAADGRYCTSYSHKTAADNLLPMAHAVVGHVSTRRRLQSNYSNMGLDMFCLKSIEVSSNAVPGVTARMEGSKCFKYESKRILSPPPFLLSAPSPPHLAQCPWKHVIKRTPATLISSSPFGRIGNSQALFLTASSLTVPLGRLQGGRG